MIIQCAVTRLFYWSVKGPEGNYVKSRLFDSREKAYRAMCRYIRKLKKCSAVER